MRRATLLVSILSVVGMTFSYARDVLIASEFGASRATDVYYVAIFLPIALYTLLISGALNPVVVPILTEFAHAQEYRRFWATVSTMLTLLTIVLAAVTATGILGAPLLVRLLAPGFDPAAAHLAVDALRVAFPSVLFAGLAALVGSVLNSLDSFVVPATDGVIVSAGVIVAAVLAVKFGITVAAAGWTVGNAAYLLVLLVAIRRKQTRLKPSVNLGDPAIRQAGRLLLPLVLFMSLAQVLPWVQRSLSSLLEAGSLSRLTYAIQLAGVPNTVFAASVALVLLPRLSRQAAAREFDDLARSLEGSLKACNFVLVPATASLIVYRFALVRLIYGHGRFTAHDTNVTANLMALLALAIVPIGLAAVLHDGYYARALLWPQFWIGLVNTGFAVVLAVVLVGRIGVYGLAVAVTASQVVHLVLTAHVYRSRVGHLHLGALGTHGGRALLAAAPMVAVMYTIAAVLAVVLPAPGPLALLLTAGAGIALGCVTYFLSAYRLGLPETRLAVTLVRDGARRISGRAAPLKRPL